MVDLSKRIDEALAGDGELNLDEIVNLLREAREALDPDREVAIAQAVEFAQYVADHAKGKMEDAATHFLSLPYAQELAKRIQPPEK